MDKPKPRHLTRQQLATFLGSSELIRAFEAYIRAIAEIIPDELEDLQLRTATAAASLSEIIAILADSETSAQAARIQALSLQLDQLREQFGSEPGSSGELLGLQSQLAQLRESVSALSGSGMSIKRIVQDTVTIPATQISGTTVISPAISGLAELRYLGTTNAATSSTDPATGYHAMIALSGSTVTATRYSTAAYPVEVSFEITEYNS